MSIREIVAPASGAKDALKAEAVLTAIDTAVGLSSGRKETTVKYHPDTGLIIVQGPPDEVSLVAEVVAQIRSDVRGRSEPAPKDSAGLEKRIALVESKIGRLMEAFGREMEKPQDSSPR